ncbi:MAG: hypothetical protein U5Q03_15025 [Bacteroidota bacterium]|nr:hypothetical protein [Bacteroidota bacterium]
METWPASWESVVHINVAGEEYLYAPEEDEGNFEVLSTLEVNERRSNTKADDPKIGDEDYLLRIWRQAPWKHTDPDSALRSVQAQCEQPPVAQ